MMPQNLDALFSAFSATPAAGNDRAGMFGGEDAVAAWAEALAMFESGGEMPESLQTSLADDRSAALDWLGQLGELNTLVDQALESDAPIGEELLNELQALLGVLEGSMPGMPHPALLGDLPEQIGDGLARLRVGMAQLLESNMAGASNPDDLQATEIAQRLRDSMATLADLSEQVADLVASQGAPAGPALQALSAVQQSLQRAAGADDRGQASVQQRPDGAALAGREAAMARLAELAAAARESGEANPASRALPEITRAVLLAQQFQNLAPAQSLPGESPLQNLRADSASPLLAAQSAAPPREPALPPTAQLLGQPGATAGEMRAAAEQAMQRVIWMAAREQGISQARLQLHPAHLGKVDVQLEVNGREANVVLNVQNGPVREAMEAMLPRLREQLEQQGINLGDASVFDADSQDAAPEERKAGFAGAVAEAGDGEGDELPVQNELNLRGRGLLDAYA